LKIFGSIAYIYVPKENWCKLDNKTLRCLFLGYNNETKGYRLYDNISKQIIINRDVIFNESKIGFCYLQTQIPKDDIYSFSFNTNPHNPSLQPHSLDPEGENQDADDIETPDFQDLSTSIPPTILDFPLPDT